MYKLNKQEGKLKELPGMEKPDVKTIHFSDYQQTIEDYNKHLATLKSYQIEISDWEGFEDGQEVGEFVLQHQVYTEIYKATAHWDDCSEVEYKSAAHDYRRIIARPKPSVKEKIEDEKVHYEALLECCNKILDSIDAGKVPERGIIGLRILLNRPAKFMQSSK